MLWMRRLVPFLVLPLFFTACSNKQRAINDDISVLQMRGDYVQNHPAGKYNRYIEKGEVVRGMNLVEVSASWGLPEARWKSKDPAFEYWTFFGQDEISGDWSRYTLVFEKNVLVDWALDRHFNKNGTLTEWQVLGDGTGSAPDQRASSDGAASSK
jgi:hypothetical protein